MLQEVSYGGKEDLTPIMKRPYFLLNSNTLLPCRFHVILADPGLQPSHLIESYVPDLKCVPQAHL